MLNCENIYQSTKQSIERKSSSILIIEASKTISDTIFVALSKNKNNHAEVVSDLETAKELFLKNDYDFVIMNLNISLKTPDNLIQEIAIHSNAKTIVLTDKEDIQVRENLFHSGVLDYIVMGNDFSFVINSIEHTIRAIEGNVGSSILLINDSISIYKQIEKILQMRNYKVLTASSADECYHIFKKNNINTIILDIDFSKNNGFNLLKEIKDKKELCHIPVIIVSKERNPELLRSSLRSGASDFIAKPFNVEELTLKIGLAVQTNKNFTEVLCTKKILDEYKDAIDDSAFVSKTNLKGIITYVNDMFCEISGYTRDELLGSHHNIVRHPDMDSSIFTEMWKTIQSKKIWKGIIKNKKKDGSSYYVKSVIHPIVSADGNIIEYIAIRTDITELESYKQILQKELKVSSNNFHYFKQYENAIDTFVAVIKTDINNNITYINQNFSQLSGYKEEELLGVNCQILRSSKHIKNGDCEKILKNLQKKKTIQFLFENKKKNKRKYFTETTIYPLLDDNGNIVDFLHLMFDVTQIINIHKELEDTQKEIVHKLGAVGESRSEETGNHVKRVAEYSKQLAMLYGLEEKAANLLYVASPMHDIGKVGIPDSILNKPAKLTKEEFEIMKTHSEIGYSILKNSKRPILKAASIISYQHHEKYDGSGYPRGLSAKQIHIFGRITAIADVFDALGSDRTYKKAWRLDKILDLLEKEKGKHFDPELIDLFINNLNIFLKVRDRFKDI